MVRTGDTILFGDRQGLITGIEQRQDDSRYELLVKDTLGNKVTLIEGDDIYTVLK